jgi:hypothetical protein
LCKKFRKINLYFPDIQIPPFSFDADSHNDSLNFQIRKMEQRNLGGTRHFDDSTYEQIIDGFNYFSDGEIEITSKTKVKEILVCFMHNSDVIALWISDIP